MLVSITGFVTYIEYNYFKKLYGRSFSRFILGTLTYIF